MGGILIDKMGTFLNVEVEYFDSVVQVLTGEEQLLLLSVLINEKLEYVRIVSLQVLKLETDVAMILVFFLEETFSIGYTFNEASVFITHKDKASTILRENHMEDGLVFNLIKLMTFLNVLQILNRNKHSNLYLVVSLEKLK